MNWREKCIEDGDCLVWTDYTSKAGVPKVAIHREGRRAVVSARRVVWEDVKGKLDAGKLITVTCGNPRCLNPDHLKTTNHAEVAAKNGARPDVKAKRAASQSRVLRSGVTKLNQKLADEIRFSDTPSRQLAEAHGVNVSTINKIKRGTFWKDHTNPFSGLLG